MTGLIRAVQLRTFIETVPVTCDPKDVFVLVSRRVNGLAILHSVAAHPKWGRWTILCAEPTRVLEVADRNGPNPLDALAEAIRPAPVARLAGLDIPFLGGWVGYLGYEAGGFLEDLPVPARSDTGLPVARFGLYGSAAIYDHLAGQWYVVGAALPEAGQSPLVGQAGVAFWKDLLREAEGVRPRPHSEDSMAGCHGHAVCDHGMSRPRTSPNSERHLHSWDSMAANNAAMAPGNKDQAEACTPNVAAMAPDKVAPSVADVDAYLASMQPSLSDEQFKAAVARAIQYIEAGDIYQVNLSRRLTTALTTTPQDLYLRLCAMNPAWYAAYLDLGDKAVLSSSPELFLQVRDGHVVTRPIKGTRPRTGAADADRLAVRELLASAKDRAELAMIIDLLRNDLGRVCRYGSVRVVEPFALEEHPTVYHLVGTIEGDLGEPYDAIDLLRATFPGGSITGAPKIRAMQIIRELEPVVRSVYCGSIGCISLDGQMTMNIAIRTMVVDGRQVHLHVGGGIVADSQPELELAETVAKARGMARALMTTVASGR